MGLFLPQKLTTQEAGEIVQSKLRWILQYSSPAEVWLFGSFARDEMTDMSDIDLALVFENEQDVKSARRSLYSASRPDDWPQDLVFYTRSRLEERATIGGLASLILKEGRLLYAEAHNES